MDEVEAELRHRLATRAGTIRSVMTARAAGRTGAAGYRPALREALQRLESARHDLSHYVRHHRRDHRRDMAN